MVKSRVSKSDKVKYFRRIIRYLTVPLFLSAVSLALLYAALQNGTSIYLFGHRMEDHLIDAASILVLAAFALLTNRLVYVFVWQSLQRELHQQVPKVLRELVVVLILFCYCCVALILVFDQPIGPILAASTVMLGVIGFTLQRPIMDAFSGVIICFQKPFQVGDWIQVDDKTPVGRVIQIDWRTVHLVTADEITLVLTNSQLANQTIKVYSRPELFFRDEIEVTLPYDVTTQQGQRILLGAANQVEEIAALPRKSIVSIASYTDRGILWRLLYWCPDPGRIPVFRFRIHQNILRNLYFSSIAVPVPMLDVRTFKTVPLVEIDDGIDKLMARIPLFATLTTSELRSLSAVIRTHLALAGKPMLHQGDTGDSLYFLREGLLTVSVKQADGTELNVGYIHPGQFFGEKSLLLGEPRGGTVTPVVDSMVSEVTKACMAKIIQNRPDIASYLSELLSERQMSNAAKLQTEQTLYDEELRLVSAKLLNRIRSIFSIIVDPTVKTKAYSAQN